MFNVYYLRKIRCYLYRSIIVLPKKFYITDLFCTVIRLNALTFASLNKRRESKPAFRPIWVQYRSGKKEKLLPLLMSVVTFHCAFLDATLGTLKVEHIMQITDYINFYGFCMKMEIVHSSLLMK